MLDLPTSGVCWSGVQFLVKREFANIFSNERGCIEKQNLQQQIRSLIYHRSVVLFKGDVPCEVLLVDGSTKFWN
jgi:hypothetical protein